MGKGRDQKKSNTQAAKRGKSTKKGGRLKSAASVMHRGLKKGVAKGKAAVAKLNAFKKKAARKARSVRRRKKKRS